MTLTPEELEAIRLADEEIEREWVEEATERQINAEIDKWVDEMAVMDLLDKKGRQQRAYQGRDRSLQSGVLQGEQGQDRCLYARIHARVPDWEAPPKGTTGGGLICRQ